MILSVPALSPKGELPVVRRAKTSTESKGRMEMRSMANHEEK